MMGDMIRVKEEAAENPPLPPLAEACIKVVETWWLAALIWTLNLELFCKGGLYQLLALAALVAGIALAAFFLFDRAGLVNCNVQSECFYDLMLLCFLVWEVCVGFCIAFVQIFL